ncbi:TraI domain-containing protein [Paracoccus sp. 1_MG-2023]|uniref:TraI domain-containing protein n=1 Tax=unclassified Paracoccus (in: a-proteobacteria) TaxID=2688777 RepID=UPI001C094F3C|nr:MULTISPECIES: TraI domain-containing protein [unclassified Paracoccus (in: a-proteobacteria)]MDO6670447.1 TraI domain-containing protein [Paracoccus sp. 1_MG-2023]
MKGVFSRFFATGNVPRNSEEQVSEPLHRMPSSDDHPDNIIATPRPETLPPDILHPDKQGIEFISAEQLLHGNLSVIEQVLDSFTDKKFIEDFDKRIVDFIRRTAYWMGPLPASRNSHHNTRGGLFAHSLAVGLASLNMGMSRNVTLGSTPRNRDADNLAWQLITFIGGMLHDIGKIHGIGRVHAYAVKPDPDRAGRFISQSAPTYSTVWEPTVQSFESWAKNNRVLSYYIDFDIKDLFPPQDYTQRYLLALVPRPVLAFIYYSNPFIRQQFEDFIRNPNAPAKTPIFAVVQDADHIDVARAQDPRRLPGSLELGTLLMRRFSEFSAEMTWNLPSSPFLYAHTQKRVGEELRYYGLPYFVASEVNVLQFEEYVMTRPMFGISIDTSRFTEIVFNALETQQVMHRTIEGLLPAQMPDPDLAETIPASTALLRFRPRQAKSISLGKNANEDALISLNVIPLKLRVPPMVMIDAPTLSFTETPSPGSAAVLSVSCETDGLQPIDHSLRHDPTYMDSFKRALAEAEREGRSVAEYPDMSPEEQAEIKTMAATVKEKVERSKAQQQKAGTARGGGRKAVSLAALRDAENMPPPAPDASGPAVPEPRAKEALAQPCAPVSASPEDPAWLRMFHEIAKAAEGDHGFDDREAWAAVWLYLRDNPQNTASAITLGSGYHGIRAATLSLNLRAEIGTALRAAGLHIRLLNIFWRSEGITSEHPRFGQWFELATDEKFRPVFRLNAKACARIKAMDAASGELSG